MNVYITNFHKWAYSFIVQHGILLYNRTVSGAKLINIISGIKANYTHHNISKKSNDFFQEEISWMKGKVFKEKEDYLDAKRVGRGTNDRVTKADKEIIWSIFSDYNNSLKTSNLFDFDDYALLCLEILESNPQTEKPFTHIIVDEAQDLSKAQILVISQLVSEETKNISIIADAAQRIYKSGFTWSEVGLNVRGRTIEFKKNYRNTIQIVKAATSLIEKEVDKSEFTTVEAARKGEIKPIIGIFNNWDDQIKFLVDHLKLLQTNNKISSTVILHRNHNGVRQIKTVIESAGFKTQELHNAIDIDFEDDIIKVCTLSSIKGLEFDNVFMVDLNDDIIPYPSGFNNEDDEMHLSTERKLVYVSMTRTRERLFMLSSGIPSRYLSEIDENTVTYFDKSI